MGSPLLASTDLRIDAHGAAAIDGLTFEAEPERVVLVGAPKALFEATCGVVRPTRGRIAVQGLTASEALATGVVAGAPLDPPMPEDWTVLAYVTWSARLVGFSATEAGARAGAAIERAGLRGEARALLGPASLATRRATSLAAALATGARVIALEEPSPSLDDAAASALRAVAVRALEGRAWILFAPTAPLTSPLVAAAQEALVVAGSRVVARGTPAELAAASRRYAVDALGAGEALAARAAERGLRVESLVVTPGSARFVLALPESKTTLDLFACAEEVGAVIVELAPIARAFA